ncbi:hypothetical protein [Pyrinomonas methylaliphatogenes]|jgi:hypothetical protein|uniref:Uncharacterized protein n=1 Tax=Pyrinomonas methylaliphatogenes TaxID=454194 RepID=A0A0B6WZI7_9BACT|nr:hypothetical protein [Pyrinomonas methylaliphatogenes]MBX5477955.1 hypothetical protein [Pyrinomonas methylaliphatogenes]CDM66683.1 hypothetical protein PYK22_02716 [Pyrinomonas methylaliphatogenes]
MRKKRRQRTILWCAIAAAIIIALLWTEQIALLYVLATLGLTILMLIVAFADLEGAKRSGQATDD